MKEVILIIRCCLVSLSAELPPDVVAYDLTKRVWYETDDLLVLHHHDWRESYLYWVNSNFDKDPLACFLPDKNTYSYIELFDKKSEKRLWRKPCPAFSRVWISPDGAYVFGMSFIKVRNPYQFVAYDRSGKRLWFSSVTEQVAPQSQGKMPKIPNVLESVSNWVIWFDQDAPRWALVREKGVAYLEFNSPVGELPKSENERGFGYRRVRIAVLPEKDEVSTAP